MAQKPMLRADVYGVRAWVARQSKRKKKAEV